MHGLLKSTVDFLIRKGVVKPRVLEMGSMISEDYQWQNFGSFRDKLPPNGYLGIDLAPGRNVDLVGDICDPAFDVGAIQTILSLEVLEHCFEFEKYITRMYGLLPDDGVLVLSTPFRIHLHGYPSDYWRFSPDAHQLLLRKHFPFVITGRLDNFEHIEFPLMVLSIAFKRANPERAMEVFQFLRELETCEETLNAKSKGWEYANSYDFRLNSCIF